MPKNNVIGCQLILEHFPEQLNFSGKNKPPFFACEKRGENNWTKIGGARARADDGADLLDLVGRGWTSF